MCNSTYKHRCIDHPDNMTKKERVEIHDLLMGHSKPKTTIDKSIITNIVIEYNQLIEEITTIIKCDLPIMYVDYHDREMMIDDVKSQFSIFDISDLKNYIDTLKQNIK